MLKCMLTSNTNDNLRNSSKQEDATTTLKNNHLIDWGKGGCLQLLVEATGYWLIKKGRYWNSGNVALS